MAKNIKKLEELFLKFATPEDKLAYELKKKKGTISALAKSNVENKQAKDSLEQNLSLELESLKGMVETILEKPEIEMTEVVPETGEEIVKKVNELEIVPEKQVDFKHIKNFPWHLVKDMGNKLISWGMGGTWLNGQTTTNSHLTVSATAPTNPEVNDLWYDLS